MTRVCEKTGPGTRNMEFCWLCMWDVGVFFVMIRIHSFGMCNILVVLICFDMCTGIYFT